MGKIYEILKADYKKLAVLIDPDKELTIERLPDTMVRINSLKPTFIFIGGSTVNSKEMDIAIELVKNSTDIPVIIFPGSHQQINEKSDGLLFLSLLSGRNPDYLIGHQVQSAHLLRKMDIEVISTAYLLIDGGKSSSVSYVSQTSPIPHDQINIAVNTAIAGEMMGFKSIFLDAGSGAINPVSPQMIAAVANEISIPLIIGGGIKTTEQMQEAYAAGADLVVVGNKIEQDINFLLDMKNYFTHKKESI